MVQVIAAKLVEFPCSYTVYGLSLSATLSQQLEPDNGKWSRRMIIVTGTVKFESLDEVEQVTKILIGRAQRSREDAGCISYNFSKNLEDPMEICLTEKWESAELLQAHLEIVDEEFNTLLGTAKITRAIVVSNEANEDRVLLER
jgi:quinol monooxygenase YgiN